MDQVGLRVLQSEMQADLKVVAEAAQLARQRFGQATPAELEATAYQLARMYNALEQMGLRVAKAFENRIDDEQGWHTELLRRLSLEIKGIRPALLTAEVLPDLQELRGFRHIVHHAYEVVLQQEKLERLIKMAEHCAEVLPRLCSQFLAQVALEQHWPWPET